MHNIIIVNKILEDLRKYSEIDNIQSINIEVGELAPITIGELDRSMKDTVDFNVNFITKKAIVICRCGYKGQPSIIERGHDSVLFECPECKETPKIIEGDNIKIIDMEVKK